MPILDLYHKRKQKAERAGEPDVYSYNELPEALRLQITRILERAVGPYDASDPWREDGIRSNNEVWVHVRDMVSEEFGLEYLVDERYNPKKDIEYYLRSSTDIDKCLSIVEYYFRVVEMYMDRLSADELKRLGAKCKPRDATHELNARFREHGIGYQFENGQIIRMDNELVHAEVVKPALLLLSDPRFAGPQEEYLAAHAHYRAREYEDTIVDANCAFESTMRTVCELMDQPAPSGATAGVLVNCIHDLAILPNYLDKSFVQLAAILKSGLPKVRDNAGGHGQGASPRQTPGYIAGYALHLCASNILFLVEAFKAAEKRESQ